MPCPRTQQANLPACSPQSPLNAERQAGKLWMPFFKVFWYDSTRVMNPRSTDCEADALTTTPSRRCEQVKVNKSDVKIFQLLIKVEYSHFRWVIIINSSIIRTDLLQDMGLIFFLTSHLLFYTYYRYSRWQFAI